MIRADQLTVIGKIFKPHGIKGELNAVLDYDLEPSDLRCIVLEIDGIFVPFFIEASRSKGSESWLLKIDGIDDEKKASALVNHEIYGVTDELPLDEEDGDDGVHLYDLVGYRLLDGDVPLGTIARIDDSTANILMLVETDDGRTIFVPFAEEFITGLDTDAHTITMRLPDGIVDLN